MFGLVHAVAPFVIRAKCSSVISYKSKMISRTNASNWGFICWIFHGCGGDTKFQKVGGQFVSPMDYVY